MIRAQLTNSTTITIDRYRTGDNIDEIVWQAVELKDGSTVQRGSERFNNNDDQEVVTLGAAVDTNRAIAFASVQPVGGQNMGMARYKVILTSIWSMAITPKEKVILTLAIWRNPKP